MSLEYYLSPMRAFGTSYLSDEGRKIEIIVVISFLNFAIRKAKSTFLFKHSVDREVESLRLCYNYETQS